MKLRTPQREDIEGKKVFLRIDADVPLKDGQIANDIRLRAALPTINFLLENNATIILAGHLGRPDPKLQPQDQNSNLSLLPVAGWLEDKLKVQSEKLKVGDFDGWKLGEKIYLLENLRFYKGEEDSDFEFSQKLALLADVYINDAFAVSHRDHASITGIARLLPHFAGLRLQKEVEVLSTVLENPKRPLAVIIGGAKIETKLPLVKKMHELADYILVGGEIAVQDEVLLKVQHEELKDHKSALLVGELNNDRTDMTAKSVENFIQIVNLAETIVWNGPLGFIENEKEDTARGTRDLAKGIIEAKKYSILGGGDTVGYLEKQGLIDGFSFVSTGGGAMLDFLAGVNLPGIEVLKE